MNDLTDDLDQRVEEILTRTVSDEALEAAAGTERGAKLSVHTQLTLNTSYCC